MKPLNMQFIPFVKYHGAGNDFIMIDDRTTVWEKGIDKKWIALACHRRFGIGADGMIFLQQDKDGADFFMKYYNSDGRPSTFCGNGGRCLVAFAGSLGIHNGHCRFLAMDGLHTGELLADGLVRITMKDVNTIDTIDENSFTLNTGSPHYVTLLDSLHQLDVFKEGKAIRNSPRFKLEGINVNFVEEVTPGEINIRTYERGVEDETFACGTGVVAAAIAASFHSPKAINSWRVHARGGDLSVDFQKDGMQQYSAIWLTGPAREVFKGELPV
jgi:diaminopimelate epimerase